MRSRFLRLGLFLRIAALLGIASAATAGILFLRRWLTHSPKFAVVEIRTAATAHLSRETLLSRIGIELGSNLFSLDLERVARELQTDPWVARAQVRRELPRTLVIEITERQAACVVAFGTLYLADANGEVFKRATPEEAVGLPVITGVPRDAYVDDLDSAQAMIREGLGAWAVWRERPRPVVGEIHVDAAAGVTLYTAKEFVGVRLGRAETGRAAETWRERLARYDAVASALRESHERPRLVLVDGKAKDRVTVRLASLVKLPAIDDRQR